mgnify:CR=1 FL=1
MGRTLLGVMILHNLTLVGCNLLCLSRRKRVPRITGNITTKNVSHWLTLCLVCSAITLYSLLRNVITHLSGRLICVLTKNKNKLVNLNVTYKVSTYLNITLYHVHSNTCSRMSTICATCATNTCLS